MEQQTYSGKFRQGSDLRIRYWKEMLINGGGDGTDGWRWRRADAGIVRQ